MINTDRMTTLKELAGILELSPSTVSKALKNRPDIGAQTKLRVKKLAKEYGYTPNYAAQSLKSGKTKNIGVIIPNLMDEFFAMTFQGIEKEAARLNYKVIVCISDDNYRKERKSLLSLVKGRVDGILISLAKETQYKNNKEYYNEIIKQGLPVVLFDRVCDEIDCEKVLIDDFNAAYQATKYLIKTGCKNIAFLSTITETSVGELRKEGYLQAIQLEGDLYSNPVFININDYKNFRTLLTTALKEHTIDGILAVDERSAICTLNIVQSIGLNVPGDVSIIGFTNGPMTLFSNPSLTTVSQHASSIGKAAARTIIKRIENQEHRTALNKIIKSELIVRDSTKII